MSFGLTYLLSMNSIFLGCKMYYYIEDEFFRRKQTTLKGEKIETIIWKNWKIPFSIAGCLWTDNLFHFNVFLYRFSDLQQQQKSIWLNGFDCKKVLRLTITNCDECHLPMINGAGKNEWDSMSKKNCNF